MTPDAPRRRTLHVACALIEHGGLVLSVRRSATMSLPLKWEFPGGKIEHGESAAGCLRRELREELGVEVEIGTALPTTAHDYPEFSVVLYPFRCWITAGEPTLHEHAEARWLSPADLFTVDWAAADLPVLDAWRAAAGNFYEFTASNQRYHGPTTTDEEQSMTAKTRSLAALALGAALLGGCAAARVPADDNGLSPYPLTKSLKAGDIIHLPTGTSMNFDQAMEMIAAAKIIYVGEMHTNLQAHEVQRRIIEELERRFPGKVAIGMEMFREPQQAALDRWTRGELTEMGFLKESKWYDNWGSDFGLYRGILTFARDHRIDVRALNPSKEIQKHFAQAGPGPLPPEIAGKIPETDFTDPFQRALLEAIFKGHETGKKPPAAEAEDPIAQLLAQAPVRDSAARTRMFESFYRTQILWEESMAANIVDYLQSPAGEGKKMVVIAGGFHVRYGLGVPRKALRRCAWPFVIVLPTELSIPEELRDELTMDVAPPEIPLLTGDFACMVPYEGVETRKVRLGVMMRVDAGTVFIDKVLPGSPAEQVGLKAGDAFVSLDDFPVTEQGDVVLVIATKQPGDWVKVRVRRDGDELLFAPLLALPPEQPAGHHANP